jgi:pyruvate kinase
VPRQPSTCKGRPAPSHGGRVASRVSSTVLIDTAPPSPSCARKPIVTGRMIRRTKIVCTLGPASSSPERIASLIAAGMDVARVNFSHGTLESHARTIETVRREADRADKPVAILGDLQGPKIRVGALPEPVELVSGDTITFAPEGTEAPGELPTTYPQLASDLEEGDIVLLADGLMELLVEDVSPPRVRMRVIHGGTLTSHKGINLPGVKMSVPSLTEKDIRGPAVRAGAEPRLHRPVVRAGSAGRAGPAQPIPEGGPPVVVKVEKGMALENLPSILEVAAAAMVARGDLGVELPFERVPLAQKRMIQLCNLSSRPVITATQMLESMIENPRPTRAEASDVANAIIDGTDAVMLSAETASGQVPGGGGQEHGADRGGDRAVSHPGLRAALRLPGGSRSTRARYLHGMGDRGGDGGSGAADLRAAGGDLHPHGLHRPGGLLLAPAGSDPRPHRQRRTYHQLALVWGVIPLLAAPRRSRSSRCSPSRVPLPSSGASRFRGSAS